MKVPILMYHKVSPLNPASKIPSHYLEPRLFQRQMRLLRRLNYSVVPLLQMFDIGGASRRISITFDDGYEDFHSRALPVLESFDYPATVFLVSNQIGGVNAWDVTRGEPEERLMAKGQILDAADRSIEFGSHTADHPDLAAVSPDEARSQIANSKTSLEETLNLPISSFCYPYGRKTRDTEALVAASGYLVACSTDKGSNTPDTNPMALRRINVRRETGLALFLYKLWRVAALGK